MFFSLLQEDSLVMILYTLAPNWTQWEMEKYVDVAKRTGTKHEKLRF